MLQEIKSHLLISINVSKDIYEKNITDDKIINIIGESGSGKSTYSEIYLKDENYIIIDTDEIYGRQTNNKNCIEFAKFLNQKYGENLPDKCENFNVIYKRILDYYKDTNKYLVIDSAQFRNLRSKEDLELLKGKMIILRTCVNECYKRVVERWKKTKQKVNNGYSEEELEKYKNRKLGMYKWYKSLNFFIENIDKI